jgi:hypothetical protein
VPLSFPMRRIFLSMARPVSTTQQRRHAGLPSRLREVGFWQRTQGSAGNLRFMIGYSLDAFTPIRAKPSYIQG